MVQQFGKFLFADQRMQLLMLLVTKLIKFIGNVNDDLAFKLVRTNSAFKLLPAHAKVLDQEDANDEVTCGQMCYAAFEQGNFAITCHSVTNWIQLHTQDQCNSNKPPVHDGQGPIQIQDPDGKLSAVDWNVVNYCVLLVFKWNSEGVYAVENGFGVAMTQFCEPVSGPERTNFMKILKPVLVQQSGNFMVDNAQLWQSSQQPNAHHPPRKATTSTSNKRGACATGSSRRSSFADPPISFSTDSKG